MSHNVENDNSVDLSRMNSSESYLMGVIEGTSLATEYRDVRVGAPGLKVWKMSRAMLNRGLRLMIDIHVADELIMLLLIGLPMVQRCLTQK